MNGYTCDFVSRLTVGTAYIMNEVRAIVL